MVHNGIEYGIMAAYAEGLGILEHADIGIREREKDAETAPLQHPEFYKYDIDIPAVAELWRRGIRGRVVAARPHRARAGRVARARGVQRPGVRLRRGSMDRAGGGRGRRAGARAHAALYERFASQGDADFANKLQSAMRKQFGGHVEKIVRDEGMK